MRGKESSSKRVQVVKKMIINKNINSFSNLYTANAVMTTKQSNSASRNQKARSFQDEMILSKDAQTFKNMLIKLQTESDVRQDKVDEYSHKIEDGSYNIKAENIAASIIESSF